MKLSKYLLMTLLVGCLAVISCEDEETTAPPAGNDPNVFCDENLCATNDALKQQCIAAYNTCIANEPDLNDDECVATALLICKP